MLHKRSPTWTLGAWQVSAGRAFRSQQKISAQETKARIGDRLGLGAKRIANSHDPKAGFTTVYNPTGKPARPGDDWDLQHDGVRMGASNARVIEPVAASLRVPRPRDDSSPGF